MAVGSALLAAAANCTGAPSGGEADGGGSDGGVRIDGPGQAADVAADLSLSDGGPGADAATADVLDATLADGDASSGGDSLSGGDSTTGADGPELDAAGALDAADAADAADAWSAPIRIPVDAPYDKWTWIPIQGAQCADGSPTGFGINPHAGSSRILIWVKGGGYCTSYAECGGVVDGGSSPTATNLTGFGSADFFADVNDTSDSGYTGNSGIFDRADPQNVFHDFNLAYFPYCTGDVHSGNRVAVYTDGASSLTIRHVGYVNVARYLSTLVPTFPGAQLVALTGSSAGGFGSLFNYAQVRAAFATVGASVVLVDDAGETLRPKYATVALQDLFNSSWATLANAPPGCTLCDANLDGGGIHNLWSYYASDPAFRGALVQSMRDQKRSAALAQPPGNPAMACSAADLGSPCLFPTGLLDLNDNVSVPASLGTIRNFLVSNYAHTWLHRSLENTAVQGYTLAQFLADIVGGAPGWHSGIPCNDLGNSYVPSAESASDASVPEAGGGALPAGYYERLSDVTYGGPASSSAPFEMVRVTPSDAGASQYTIERVLKTNGGPDEAITSSATTSGAQLSLQQTCPPVDGGPSPQTISYSVGSAAPRTVVLYFPVPDAGASAYRLVTYGLQDGG
jgi:hypothetical protein